MVKKKSVIKTKVKPSDKGEKAKRPTVNGNTVRIVEGFQDGIEEYNHELNYYYAQYLKVGRTYHVFLPPYYEVIERFWQEYQVEPRELAVPGKDGKPKKIFYAEMEKLPKNKLDRLPVDEHELTFVEFKNYPIPPEKQKEASKIHDFLMDLNELRDWLKREHDEEAKKLSHIINHYGVMTRKGAPYHRKMLTGNDNTKYASQFWQIFDEVRLEIPNLDKIKDLMRLFPKHRGILKKLLKLLQVNRYDVYNLEDGDLLGLVKRLRRYNLKDIEISFICDDDFNLADFENEEYDINYYDEDDDDEEKGKEVTDTINKLPFEIKLKLYKMGSVKKAKTAFHYKTHQKTKPDCRYCGDAFLKNTVRCGTCGLVNMSTPDDEIVDQTFRKKASDKIKETILASLESLRKSYRKTDTGLRKKKTTAKSKKKTATKKKVIVKKKTTKKEG